MSHLAWSVALLFAMGNPPASQPPLHGSPGQMQSEEQIHSTWQLFEDYNILNLQSFAHPSDSALKRRKADAGLRLARMLTRRLRQRDFLMETHYAATKTGPSSAVLVFKISNELEVAEQIDLLRFAEEAVRRDKQVATAAEIKAAIVRHARREAPRLLQLWARSGYAWSEASDELWLYLTCHKIPPSTLGIPREQVAQLAELARQRGEAKR